MSKRVYKFTSAQYGLCNLENRRVKLSTINDLNDPFDLTSIDTTDPVIENALAGHIKSFWRDKGLLCFSRNWDNLLLWSHYGAAHTGLCLGFDIPDGPVGDPYGVDVRYQPNLLKSRPEHLNYDLVIRLLTTKHESWSYEQEVRLFLQLNDPPDAKGLSWFNFGPALQLREVIVGSQCTPNDLDAVARVLKNYGTSVGCSWAYMRKDAFLLVRHNSPPPWFPSAAGRPPSNVL
jgi:hypothetical protein